MEKVDPLKGLNPDQSGPREKIQNGDPRSGPNRDQRSGAAESGGPGESLQKGPTGTPEGQVPPHEGLVDAETFDKGQVEGVEGDTERAGSLDRAGGPYAGTEEGNPDIQDRDEKGLKHVAFKGEGEKAENKDAAEKGDAKSTDTSKNDAVLSDKNKGTTAGKGDMSKADLKK